MRKVVLGVPIDDITKNEVLEKIKDSIASLQNDTRRHPGGRSPIGSFLVTTPGPEFLVTAQKDLEFKNILQNSDLNIPDGVGLQLLAGINNRYPGVDLCRDLLKLSVEKKLTIGIIAKRFVKDYELKLKGLYPGIKINFCLYDYDIESNTNLSCDILFVALGHPTQEFLLRKLKNQNQKFQQNNQKDKKSLEFGVWGLEFQVGIGVGGSFDFICGLNPEPSEIWSKLGMKWLARFFHEPRYMFPKVFRAIIVFPLLLFFTKFGHTE